MARTERKVNMTQSDKIAVASATLALVSLALAWWGFGW